MRFWTVLLFFNALYSEGALAKESLPVVSFEALRGFQTPSLPQKKPLLLYFFQPDCSSCAKQKKDLACLAKNIEIVSLGVFGAKRELVKEAQKYHLHGLLLYGGKRAEKLFSIKQTPTLLFYNSKGELKNRTEQWMNCEDIRKITLE